MIFPLVEVEVVQPACPVPCVKMYLTCQNMGQDTQECFALRKLSNEHRRMCATSIINAQGQIPIVTT